MTDDLDPLDKIEQQATRQPPKGWGFSTELKGMGGRGRQRQVDDRPLQALHGLSRAGERRSPEGDHRGDGGGGGAAAGEGG